jgi:hypothetical protein
MQPNSDLIDLLRAFNAAGADYLLVGGYAVAIHGKMRATKDVDVFIGTDAENAAKVRRALASFGAPLDDLTIEDLTRPETLFIMGRPPNQSDIITNRVESTFGGVRVCYIGKDDLIANKTAAGRPQDRIDLEYLRGAD